MLIILDDGYQHEFPFEKLLKNLLFLTFNKTSGKYTFCDAISFRTHFKTKPYITETSLSYVDKIGTVYFFIKFICFRRLY